VPIDEGNILAGLGRTGMELVTIGAKNLTTRAVSVRSWDRRALLYISCFVCNSGQTGETK
jgi:hypothetical protein